MSLKKKSLKVGTVFILILLIAGGLLLYKGNDPIVQAIEKKDGIITAEQVKVAFDSVSGRLVNEAVKESQEVKKGDILMVLDSTDVDLSIEKAKAQITQLDSQIKSLNGSIDIGYSKTDTNEQQSLRQIDQQRAAVDAAKATYENRQLDYKRKVTLAEGDAISRSELDNARANLNVAEASLRQQQHALSQLLSGTGYSDSGLVLPAIEQRRQELGNQQNDIDSLKSQKKLLEVQLKELEVKKDRLTLRAPEDGKIIKIIAKQGEMIPTGTVVLLLESKRYYYDIYLSEKQSANISEGDTVSGMTIAAGKRLDGIVRLKTAAPGFADLKMSREKGQADLAVFQIRIYTDQDKDILPGMTVEVNANEFAKR